ncbi:hypothetical protein ACWCXC_36775 [Streptomyces sp. NPDC001515]
MMPPSCAMCRASRGDHPFDFFTLVYFRRIEPPTDREGHPANAVWFCADHVRFTEGKTHMSAMVAMVHIRAAVRRARPSIWPLTSLP